MPLQLDASTVRREAATVLRDAARSTLYLLVSFPLGVAYFALVVGGVAAGISLLVFVVGVVVLAATAAAARRVAALDAAFGARVYGLPAPSLAAPRSTDGLFDAAVAELATPAGYRATAYLVARFGVGLAGFTYVVTWLSVSGALLGAPLYYDAPGVTVGVPGAWTVTTLPGALAVAAAGAVVAAVGAVVVAPAGRVAVRATGYVLELPRPAAT
ncbi:sensor domain-containing protein [Halobacterium yunchengense]|uniref:sensor domain-containing protein n=1 Tax=Halobacterium yunchengense TaxID=3108497 RepID=UPI00300839D5